MICQRAALLPLQFISKSPHGDWCRLLRRTRLPLMSLSLFCGSSFCKSFRFIFLRSHGFLIFSLYMNIYFCLFLLYLFLFLVQTMYLGFMDMNCPVRESSVFFYCLAHMVRIIMSSVVYFFLFFQSIQDHTIISTSSLFQTLVLCSRKG